MSTCGKLIVCNKLQTEARRHNGDSFCQREAKLAMLHSDCKAFYGLDSEYFQGLLELSNLILPPPPPLPGQCYKQRLAVIQRRRRHAARQCSICFDTAAGSRAAEVSGGIKPPCLSTPPPPDATRKGQQVRLIVTLPMTFVDRVGASECL